MIGISFSGKRRSGFPVTSASSLTIVNDDERAGFIPLLTSTTSLLDADDDYDTFAPRAGYPNLVQSLCGTRPCPLTLPRLVPFRECFSSCSLRLHRSFMCNSSSIKRSGHAVCCYCYQAPEIVATFALSVSPNDVRRAVRAEFERNRYVSDPKVIDVLLVKGQQSYQETMNAWSQEPHILGILLAPKSRPQRTFMEKFLEGACFPRSLVWNGIRLPRHITNGCAS